MINKIFFLIFIFMMATSCKKFVNPGNPKTQLISTAVFTDDNSSISAITGIYSRMIQSSGFAGGGLSSVTTLCGLSADEFRNYSISPNTIQFYTNSLSPSNTTLTASLWNEPYQYIYSANAVIEGLENSTGVTPSLKIQLTSEAKFIRAFSYFYLVNLFGDVPLVTTTDYAKNEIMPRTASAKVYDQIISDLKDGQNMLADDYSVSNGERIRPNKWVATAFLSKVYLFRKNYDSAELQASAVINNSGLFGLDSNLNDVFLANSTEAIWQLMPNIPGFNTSEGKYFILSGVPLTVALTPWLINAFETSDKRFTNWVMNITVEGNTYYYPFKYKIRTGSVVTEYSMVLRLAEQYLIRAEARAQQNNLTGASSDLNIIRQRAGLSPSEAVSQGDLLSAILHERQVELFTEWGHRWLDLKRTGAVNSVMSAVTPYKGGSWNSDWQLYPIPFTEISNNSAISQNPNY